MSIFLKNYFSIKKRAFQRKSAFLSRIKLVFRSSALEPKHAVGDKRRKDQPERGDGDDRIHDHRADGTRARKDRGHEVQFEQTEKAPVDRANDDENISTDIHNTHNVFLLQAVCFKRKELCIIGNNILNLPLNEKSNVKELLQKQRDFIIAFFILNYFNN